MPLEFVQMSTIIVSLRKMTLIITEEISMIGILLFELVDKFRQNVQCNEKRRTDQNHLL